MLIRRKIFSRIGDQLVNDRLGKRTDKFNERTLTRRRAPIANAGMEEAEELVKQGKSDEEVVKGAGRYARNSGAIVGSVIGAGMGTAGAYTLGLVNNPSQQSKLVNGIMKHKYAIIPAAAAVGFGTLAAVTNKSAVERETRKRLARAKVERELAEERKLNR